MFAFLLIVQSVVALSLVGVILMQRSEGGGLGVGGSSSGFMTARGASDFLTRSTSILGGIFISLSIAMAGIAGATRQPAKIDTSLAGKVVPLESGQPAPGQSGAAPAPASGNAPAAAAQQNQQDPAIPLAQ